jgi:cytochrome c peroxidase
MRFHRRIATRISGAALALLVLCPARLHADPACPKPRRDEPITPVPQHIDEDPRKVELGKVLFHDPRLSRNDQISCSTCHPIEKGGADGRARSVGVDDSVGATNAPTVLNSRFNFRQFWDGRADTLQSRVDGLTHSAAEMGSSWDEIVTKLSKDAELVQRFRRAYASGPNADTVRDAIARYERTLVTPGAKLDRYLCGEDAALSPEELSGYRRFKHLGCASCHQGINVGGNMYQRFGVMDDYFAARSDVVRADLGRFNVTGRSEDRHVFKVPGLRNVERTAPYFHDGSAATLEDAVRIMGRYQLGRELSGDEVRSLIAFLRTLTGTTP